MPRMLFLMVLTVGLSTQAFAFDQQKFPSQKLAFDMAAPEVVTNLKEIVAKRPSLKFSKYIASLNRDNANANCRMYSEPQPESLQTIVT